LANILKSYSAKTEKVYSKYRGLFEKNLYNVTQSQEQIIGYCHKDIVTYSPINERLAIQEIYDGIPSEIDSKNKRLNKIYFYLANTKALV